MMIGPSPTQQKPEHDVNNGKLEVKQSEVKQIRSTPARPRTGQTPIALFFKAIFRPIFKGIYYLLQAIRGHRLLTLAIIVLLLASIAVTTFFTTGQFPFGIGSDQFNFHTNGNSGGGDQVQNWLYALREGNVTTLTLLDKNMSSPPDPQQFVNQFSQTQAHLYWKSIDIVSVHTESDSTVDVVAEVDVSANGPGGTVTGIMLWHFVTFSQGTDILLKVNLVDFRAPIQ